MRYAVASEAFFFVLVLLNGFDVDGRRFGWLGSQFTMLCVESPFWFTSTRRLTLLIFNRYFVTEKFTSLLNNLVYW